MVDMYDSYTSDKMANPYNICARCGEQVKEFYAAGDLCRECVDELKESDDNNPLACDEQDWRTEQINLNEDNSDDNL